MNPLLCIKLSLLLIKLSTANVASKMYLLPYREFGLWLFWEHFNDERFGVVRAAYTLISLHSIAEQSSPEVDDS